MSNLGEPRDQVGLIRDGVKNVPDEELAGPRAVAAEAAVNVRAGRQRLGDHLRRVALRADQRPVRDHLDSVARHLPFMADVGGANLVLAGQRLALERIQVKGHLPECRVRG